MTREEILTKCAEMLAVKLDQGRARREKIAAGFMPENFGAKLQNWGSNLMKDPMGALGHAAQTAVNYPGLSTAVGAGGGALLGGGATALNNAITGKDDSILSGAASGGALGGALGLGGSMLGWGAQHMAGDAELPPGTKKGPDGRLEVDAPGGPSKGVGEPSWGTAGGATAGAMGGLIADGVLEKSRIRQGIDQAVGNQGRIAKDGPTLFGKDDKLYDHLNEMKLQQPNRYENFIAKLQPGRRAAANNPVNLPATTSHVKTPLGRRGPLQQDVANFAGSNKLKSTMPGRAGRSLLGALLGGGAGYWLDSNMPVKSPMQPGQVPPP